MKNTIWFIKRLLKRKSHNPHQSIERAVSLLVEQNSNIMLQNSIIHHRLVRLTSLITSLNLVNGLKNN